MKKKFLQMFLCSVLVSIFLIGCGEAKDSTVNESQTIINQEANEIESETNQTTETSNVSESVVVDANDRWGGMTEKELALLTPEEMPNCQVGDNGIHSIFYNGKLYIYADDHNKYMESIGSDDFIDYSNAWVSMGETITVLGEENPVEQASVPEIINGEIRLEINDSHMYNHVYYNIDVVDVNGNRFKLPNGVEWISAEAHFMKTEMWYLQDCEIVESVDEVKQGNIAFCLNDKLDYASELTINGYVGEIWFRGEDGNCYKIYITTDMEQEFSNYFGDDTELTTATNYTNYIYQNPIVLSESNYTLEELLPAGHDNLMTNNAYYINNGGSFIQYDRSYGCTPISSNE